jgi:hypothetical protein
MALVRKNLIVNAEHLQALAQRRGMSESAAVREAVDQALAVDEVMRAVRGLHDAGAFAEPEKRFQPAVEEAATRVREPRPRTRRGPAA